ncbi:MAG: hypothetical protein ACFFA6_11995 [Promethearchaeota archaeon]
MNKSEEHDHQFLSLKIVQGGDIIKIALTDANLSTKFKKLYVPILKELNLKQKDIFFSNVEGKMLLNHDLGKDLKTIIERFGNNLRLYSEKIF